MNFSDFYNQDCGHTSANFLTSPPSLGICYKLDLCVAHSHWSRRLEGISFLVFVIERQNLLHIISLLKKLKALII
jgi:hypothetical protein